MSYFGVKELACPCCGETRFLQGFFDELNDLRHDVGHPLILNSAYRCPDHNRRVGGKVGGFHPKGCAVDVSTADWSGAKKWKFVTTAMKRGWSVGVAKTFIHIDLRVLYPEFGWAEPVLFTY